MLEINQKCDKGTIVFLAVEEWYMRWVIMQGNKFSDNNGITPQHRLEDVAKLTDTDFRHWLTHIIG